MTRDQEREISRKEREAEFDRMLAEYLADEGTNLFGDGRKFRFGGACNLICAVRLAFVAAHDRTGFQAYADVAEALKPVENIANQDYSPVRELEAA